METVPNLARLEVKTEHFVDMQIRSLCDHFLTNSLCLVLLSPLGTLLSKRWTGRFLVLHAKWPWTALRTPQVTTLE